MTDDTLTPSRPKRTTVTVGGPVDEMRVTLAIYGADLDPVEISTVLCCEPTSSHRRGETRIGKKTRQKIIYEQGAWFLSAEGQAPQTPDEITNELLARVPADASLWSGLALRFDVQIRYGIFLHAWNRGFVLSRTSVDRIARLHASLNFEIYANSDDDASAR
jgi:hypothetical protein